MEYAKIRRGELRSEAMAGKSTYLLSEQIGKINEEWDSYKPAHKERLKTFLRDQHFKKQQEAEKVLQDQKIDEQHQRQKNFHSRRGAPMRAPDLNPNPEYCVINDTTSGEKDPIFQKQLEQIVKDAEIGSFSSVDLSKDGLNDPRGKMVSRNLPIRARKGFMTEKEYDQMSVDEICRSVDLRD